MRDHVFPDIFDRSEAETDIITDRREVQVGLVDIRGQNGDTHAPRLDEIAAQLVAVVSDRREKCRDEFSGVMRLEIRREIGDDAIGGRVRLVERVIRERYKDVPQRLDGRFGVSALQHSGGKEREFLVQRFFTLFTHCATQVICLTK